MANNRQLAIGEGNIQIDGNSNIVDSTIVFQTARSPLTHSLIHDLLGIVCALPDPQKVDYSLRRPAQLHDKLRFNNAAKYMQVIDNHVSDLVRVDEAMKSFPDSESIVVKLRDMFLDVADFDDDCCPCVGNGDAQLDQIKARLLHLITHDAKFDADSYPLEQIERFCIALIAHGVSKCKILETPV